MGILGKTREMGKWGLVVLAIVMVARTTRVADAQEDGYSCVTGLAPCTEYLNSTKPPASCCTPLRKAVATQLECLCGLLNDRALFESMNFNITQVLELPQHCGIIGDISACSKFSDSSPSASPTDCYHHSPLASGTPDHTHIASGGAAHTPSASSTPVHAPSASYIAPSAHTPSASPAHTPSALPAHDLSYSVESSNGVVWNGMPYWLVLLAFMVV